MDAFFSVLITAYNAETTIIKTLTSISNQTYANYEIVLVDDGSADRTIELVRQLVETKGIRNLRLLTPGRLGRVKALNFGVSQSKGEWIAICDADDLWHPRKLEVQAGLLSSADKNLVVLATRTLVVHFDEEVTHAPLPSATPKLTSISLKKMLTRTRVCHSSCVIKKEYCVYDESRVYQDDTELFLRLLTQKMGIAICDRVLTYRVIHENQNFEARNITKFIWSSYLLRNKYILLAGKYYLLPFNVFKLGYGLLPRSFRMEVQKMRAKKWFN